MSGASADVIHLKSGGELRGELVESPLAEGDESSPPLEIMTLAGSRVSVAREAVLYVARRSMQFEQYVSRARQIPHTVEAHLALAEWCRDNYLGEERKEQLELLLELDPDHEEARRILGYTLEDGKWMTREEIMTSRGYIKYKGRWVTQQELDLLQKQQAQREAEVAWYPKVRLWYVWLTGNDTRRRDMALDEFRKLESPDAIPALTSFLGEHEQENVRQLYANVLGHIGGPEAALGLVERYLFDGSETVRQQSLLLIPPDQHAAVLPKLVKALKDDSNHVVRRAGAALGMFGNPAAVPALIEALVTSHKYQVPVRSRGSIGFGYTPNGQVGMVPPGASSVLPPEIAMLAAAGQLPYGYEVVPFPGTSVTRYVTVRAEVQNEEVLSALKSITGKDFGYNEHDWHLWWAINKS